MTIEGWVFLENSIRLSRTARLLWAKTGGGEQIDLWSPLYVHMGDTAETIRLLWREWLPDAEKRLISNAVGSDETAETLVAWLGAVHDIGKATPAFQYKVDGRAELVREAGLRIPASNTMPCFSHAFMGHIILGNWLESRGWAYANTFSCVVGGHHGSPPNSEAQLRSICAHSSNFPNEALGDERWSSVQDELLSFAFETIRVGDTEESLSQIALPQTVQVLLTGLVIMADWIASNSDLFPLVPELAPIQGFDQRACTAWTELNLPSSWHAKSCISDDKDLFHKRFVGLPENAVLRPAQSAAVKAALELEEPGLIIIEAPMGNGKTEASLLCAEILAGKFGDGGVSYLLPTMATSNAMFSRVEEWLSNVPDGRGNSRQSMQLLHGKAALNPEFARLKTWRSSWMGDDAVPGRSDWSQPEGIIAHQWFGGRKRGLLASFVVGTVDQLLMAALKTRHVQLRHLGLAGKVVVIDEVHAYDAYMGVYLDRVMAWLGAYGVPTILLSATLPPERRNALIRAYRGSDGKPPTRPSRRKVNPYCVLPVPRRVFGAPSYPLITSASRDPSLAPSYRACTITESGTDVSVEYLPDDDESLLNILRDFLSDGGCACVLRDTVGRAQATYDLLKEHLDAGGIEVKLVHSRFISIDRMANDAELLQLLGPDSSRRPERFIVVGTQVVEQSLDIDFDLMISDIAPIDLLLQRMGRLHRHQRGEGQELRPHKLRKARFIVTGAEDWNADPPIFDKAITYVYQPALLWRSVLALRNHEGEQNSSIVNLPHDIAGLVERVYESEQNDAIPESWQEALTSAQVEMERARNDSALRANSWLLGRPHLRGTYDLVGWLGASLPSNDEQIARATVRDTQESLEVIVMQENKGKLEILPWVKSLDGAVPANRDLGNGEAVPSDEVARLAANCTVSLPPRLTQPWFVSKVITSLEGRHPVPGWQESRWLKGQLPLVFDIQGNTEIDCGEQAFHLRYSREKGLELANDEQVVRSLE